MYYLTGNFKQTAGFYKCGESALGKNPENKYRKKICVLDHKPYICYIESKGLVKVHCKQQKSLREAGGFFVVYFICNSRCKLRYNGLPGEPGIALKVCQ